MCIFKRNFPFKKYFHSYKISNTFSYLTLEKGKVIDSNSKEERELKGNISLSLNNYTNLEDIYKVGDIIVFNSTLKPTKFYDEKSKEIETFYIKSNIRYLTDYIDLSEITIIGSNLTLAEKLKEYNRSLLISNMGEIEGNLAYSLLYGDKSTSNKETLNLFKYSGVIHMFSVSGLHVSLIVSILFFFLKKLKINSKISFGICSAVLLIFCYLCSFTSSVVRATIMSLVYLLSLVVNRKNDILNSVSIAGIILLILNPLTLFDGGFQLSFMAVFGILLCSNIFNKIKFKNKILKYVFGLTAVTISTQIAIFPILAKFYGYFATWSIFANLISIPIFSVFYPILFVFNLLVLILPFISFILYLPLYLLKLIIVINSFICSFPISTLSVSSWGLFAVVIFYFALFVVSKYMIISSTSKVGLFCALICICNVLIYYNNMPYYNKQNSVVAFNSATNNSIMLTTTSNEYFLINPSLKSGDLYSLEEDLKNKNIKEIKAVFLCFYQSYSAKRVYEFLEEYNAKFYTIPSLKNTEELILLGANVEEVTTEIKITESITYSPVVYGKSYCGAKVIFYNKSILILDCTKLNIEKFCNFLRQNYNIVFSCVKLYNVVDKFKIESIIGASKYFYAVSKDYQIVFT